MSQDFAFLRPCAKSLEKKASARRGQGELERVPREEGVLRGCNRNRLEAGESVDLMIG